MLPYSLPSSVSAFGRRQMKAYPYTPKAGDVAWVNYIPVKFVSDNYQEGTYNQKGFVAIDILSSNTGKQAWVDYVPVVIDDTRTDAWLVNRVGYIPVNFSGTGDGTAANKGLSLNFVGASTLDPRITFSRASNATVTGSNGLIQYAPHNLLTYSEQFDNSAWIKFLTSATANQVVSPDGTTTADYVMATSPTAAYPTVSQAISVQANTTYTFSVYVRAGERSSITFQAYGNSSTYINATTVTGLTNSWQRITLTVNSASFTTIQIRIGFSDTAVTWTGTQGFYLWGAQAETRASVGTYNPTTVKNLLGYSEAFDNAAWTKNNISATANTSVTAAPNGTMTADKLVEDTSTAAHFIGQTASYTAGIPYTLSYYAKSAERTFARVGFSASSFPSSGRAACFNLSTGAVGDVQSGVTASITSVGNGWYRCSITVTATTTASSISNGAFIAIQTTNTASADTYTGNGTSGIYVWGAQLSDSASLDTYVNNPVAAPTAAAYYGPRFDYDPVTLQPKGLLIEEQRTNLFQRSEEFDNAYWVKENTTVTANTVTSPDGTQDADSIVSGASGYTNFRRAGTTVTANTAHTASIYVKAGSGATTFSITLANNTFTSGVTSVFNLSTGTVTSTTPSGTATSTSSTITAVGNGWYRVTSTAIVDTTSTSIRVDYVLGNFSSTIYAWGAQVEAGAFATSYIPTTASQVTRSADVALIQGSNFSGWYNQSEGSIVAKATVNGNPTGAISQFPRIVSASDGTSNNRIELYYRVLSTITDAGYIVVTGGTTQAQLDTVDERDGQTSSVGYKVNDFAFVIGGTVKNTDTSGTVPTVDRMNIGASVSAANPLNGCIRSIAYYPRRLTNQELQAVTA